MLRKGDVMTTVTRRNFLVGLAAAPLAAGFALRPALAASLDDLRAGGKVGERFDGYAVALSGDAKSTVKNVNAKRRNIYEQKAAAQGVSADAVGRVYAKQIMKRAPKGTKFMQENGSWTTK